MKKGFICCCLICWAFLCNPPADASPIDFSTWSPLNWGVTARTPSEWEVRGNDGSYASQLNASGPNAYLNNLSQTDYEMEGTFRVCSTAPFGVVGFVFGYQDPSHFYLFDWRRFNGPAVGIEGIGFTIRKFSASSVSDLDIYDFQSSRDTANMEVLASFYGPYNRWSPFASYNFFLDYQPGTFQVTISNSGTLSTIWDVIVEDDAYSYGQFGLYNFSQAMVLYSGFEQNGGLIEPAPGPAPVPEPATIFLLGAGLFALAALKKRCSHPSWL